MDLLTKEEIIQIAFPRRIDTKRISDAMITMVQEQHIRDLLGDDFYEAILDAPSSYATVVNYLKNVISYFVKFYILPDVFLEIADTGIVQIVGQNRQVVDRNMLEFLRQETLTMARRHTKILEKYLYDNQASYPLYYYNSSPDNNVVTRGGIVFKKNKNFNQYETIEDEEYL